MTSQQGLDGVEEERVRIEGLLADIEGARCRLRACLFLHTVASQRPDGLDPAQMADLRISGDAAAGAPTKVEDQAMIYRSAAVITAQHELTLTTFPPGYEAVPCKPLLFDVAQGKIDLPDLSAHKKAESRGLLGRLWGGLSR